MAGMSGGQLRRLKELEKENERLRRAVNPSSMARRTRCSVYGNGVVCN